MWQIYELLGVDLTFRCSGEMSLTGVKYFLHRIIRNNGIRVKTWPDCQKSVSPQIHQKLLKWDCQEYFQSKIRRVIKEENILYLKAQWNWAFYCIFTVRWQSSYLERQIYVKQHLIFSEWNLKSISLWFIDENVPFKKFNKRDKIEDIKAFHCKKHL